MTSAAKALKAPKAKKIIKKLPQAAVIASAKKKTAEAPTAYDKAVEKLIALGKKSGRLTLKQVQRHLPPDVLSSEKFEEVVKTLGKNKIQIDEPDNRSTRDSGTDGDN